MNRIFITALIVISAWSCDRNHAPIISGITCSPESRSAGTLFTVRAAASDEDGNALQYLWSADGGVFTDSVNKNQTTWKSPVDGNGRSYTIRVTVSDGKEEAMLDYPIQLTKPVFGGISGYAYFSSCTVPVPGATIGVDDKSAITDSSGFFEIMDIPIGTYTLRAAKPDFSPAEMKVNILQSVNLQVKIGMISVSQTSKLTGIVKGQDSLPIGGATVTMLNPDNTESKLTATTNAAGFYRLWYVPLGQRRIIARKVQTEEFGFEEVNLSIAISRAEHPLDIEMLKYNLVGKFTDGRDNHVYAYKVYGKQTWMTENLAFLPAVSPSKDGNDYESFYYVSGYQGRIVAEAKLAENFATYGVLYNWPAATDACPLGWHLPSDTEWKIFENFLGPDAGFRLKSSYLWEIHGNGSNSSGFCALPAGSRYGSSSPTGYVTGFGNPGYSAHFWSTASQLGSRVWARSLYADDHLLYRRLEFMRSGISVRCIRDF